MGAAEGPVEEPAEEPADEEAGAAASPRLATDDANLLAEEVVDSS